ncbi:DUF3418 domain-containing protein [Stutzerimonas stutzeri]|uniref:DUF3418 domain-containing protein n=1 Tax=Stutzerimonas stutzeri TaxID=316 RepID=UPI003EE09B10
MPGLIEAKAVTLVRGLPKAIRNRVPVPDFVGAALAKCRASAKGRCPRRWVVNSPA